VSLAARGEAERRFVREALLALGSDRPGLREAARGVRSWEGALSLAEAGSVAESVWAGVSLRGAEAEIPEPARSTFQEAHADATARNALLLSEATAVQAAFASAGIESVVLKGPGLLVAHYPDIGARRVGDVDILVRDADASLAGRVARDMGARERIPQPGYDGAPRETAQPGSIDGPLVHTERGVALEIHVGQPGGASDRSDVPGLFARSRTVEWQGRALRIPSAADLAAGVCLHVFDHHGGREAFVARHLADLSVVVGSGAVTWDEVAERMPAGRESRSLAASRRLLERGPPGVAEAYRRAVQVRAGHWMNVIAGNASSPSGLVRILFPARGYMATRYRVPEDSALLPFLYLWRPVRGLWALVTGR
jgi:hypothetical protein